MTTQKYTHKDYFNRVCTHDEFYAQFITPQLVAKVGKILGRDLLRSTDEHYNDIALKKWDLLASTLKEYSLFDAVCILKRAAKEWLKQQQG